MIVAVSLDSHGRSEALLDPVLRKLARAGRWEGDETVVAYITGAGLKTADCVASRAEPLTPVSASLRAVRERYAGLIS